MTNHKCVFDIEGQRGFFQILLLLDEHAELLQSQLYHNKPLISISNNATAIRALNLLQKYDLIMIKKKKERNGKYYCLTDKGQQCAQLFIQIKKLIEQS